MSYVWVMSLDGHYSFDIYDLGLFAQNTLHLKMEDHLQAHHNIPNCMKEVTWLRYV